MFNHELLKKNYESGIKTHQALVYTQKKVCKLENRMGTLEEQNRQLVEANRRQELLLEAILRSVSGGGNSQVTLPLAPTNVGNDAVTPPTTATSTQFKHIHDNSNDNSDNDGDAMELDLNGELEVGGIIEGRNAGGVEIVSIVSPAAAATSSNKKTASIQGKNNRERNSNKRSAWAVGDGSTPSAAKKPRQNAYALMDKGRRVQACKSGLDNYSKKKITALVVQVIHKRLPVTATNELNPLRLEKTSSQVKPKLRRLLNFISDMCETEEEYKWWSSRIPPLPANASREKLDERSAKAKAIGAAIEERCLAWVNGVGKRVNKKEGKLPIDVKSDKFNCGILQSRIDFAADVKDQWSETRMTAIASKKRTATAMEGEAE